MRKRKPQTSPSPAILESRENDDFTLPAALYYDTIYHYQSAINASDENDAYTCNRFKRAAVLTAFGFFEAQLNQIAFAHAEAHKDVLGQIERDVLEEMETILDDRGDIIRKRKFYRTESRFCFLVYFLSGKDFDCSGTLWNSFRDARKCRDQWTHPKPPFDTWSLTLSDVHKTIIVIRDMFMKLSEMMELQPPLWLQDIDDILAELNAAPNESEE